MFCQNCGQVLEEGGAFCKNCGAPAPTPAGAPPPASPPGPPAAGPIPPALSNVTAPPPPPAPGYGAGWQPPEGPAERKGRAGLIWGIIAAAIIVLAGAGVGVYFGFFHDVGDTAKTTTTRVGPASTTGGVTGTNGDLTTTTGGETGTTLAGSSTTQTIPSLTTSTSGSTMTSTTQVSAAEYLMAADNMVWELEYDDGRIPELATQINNTAPNVPLWVRDELSTMLGSLDMLNVELAVLELPPGYEDSDYWLNEAIIHMSNRIYATMQGVEAMWDTGKVNSANPFFDEGRSERDAYRAAMDKYYECLPIE